MPSQRRTPSPQRPRRVPAAALAVAAGAAVVAPASASSPPADAACDAVQAASAQPVAQGLFAPPTLHARVATLRAAWAAAGCDGDAAQTPAATLLTQAPNWTNWPKWSKWSNWANK